MSNDKQKNALSAEEELSRLISQKMPKIRYFASIAVRSGLEFDDAVQEGIIGLFSAVGSYNDEKGASFDTYASVCIQNAITSAVRAQCRKKHSPLNGAVELTNESEAMGPEDIAIQKEEYREMLKSIQIYLSPLEKRVLSLHLNGSANKQVAAALNISSKAVENALSRVRRKLG